MNLCKKPRFLDNSKLVYTVNPLPHSLLNFVFNFGKLDKDDEVKYIEKIIHDPILKIFRMNKKEDIKKEEIEKDQDFKKLHKFAKDLIKTSQNFIRKNNDISSVSLREIIRFNIFYQFFFDYLKQKKEASFDLLENEQ